MIAGQSIKKWKEQNIDIPDFEYPWDMLSWFKKFFFRLLGARLFEFTQYFKEGAPDDVVVGESVSISEHVLFDTENGPVIIDDDASIKPFSYIKGPVYIGKKCFVNSHSLLGPNVSLGMGCKIGGEVQGALFQEYSNKVHHGYVGDSYIGSWVNMGAGTCVSNLKSTYGHIRVEIDGEKVDTGEQFLGAFIGDYSKTAVNTSIMAGKLIGVNAYISGLIEKNIHSFTLMTGDREDVVDIESAIRTQKRMFERRQVEQTEEDINKLRALAPKQSR